MLHVFKVYGTVRGQGRPRMTRSGIVYKDKKDRDFEKLIRAAYKESGGVNFGESPIKLTVVVYRKLPDSKPKRMVSEPDTYKPDASNILKAVEDALNGVAYKDDKQIVNAQCVKMPRTRIEQELMVIAIEGEK